MRDFALFTAILCSVAQAQSGLTDQEINEFVDRVMQSRDYPPEALVQFASDAEAAILARGDAGTRSMIAKTCLAVGRSYYLAQQIDRGIDKLDRCIADSANAAEPTLYFQMRSLRSALLLVTNRPAESLAALSSLIAEDAEGVAPREKLRAMYYYAGALAENGQALAAHDQYQTTLEKALVEGFDLMALGIANNYLVSLLNEHEYATASTVMDKITPVLDQASPSVVRNSLFLHRWQLQHLAGKPAVAAARLQELIDTTLINDPSMQGNGYEYLADALRDLGRLDESLAAAERAVVLLQGLPLEEIDARFSLAETLLAMGRSEQALIQLNAIDGAETRTLARVEQWHQLSIEALLAIGNAEEARVRYQQLLAIQERRRAAISAQSRRYFDAKLTNQRQQAELLRMQQSRESLEQRTDAINERANALEKLSERSRQMRALVLVAVLALGLAAILLVYVSAKRRFERRLREREEELNESLQQQVEEKSEALVARIEEQNLLEQTLAKTAHIESIGKLTGSVAHDFNNLMQVIRVANEQLDIDALSPLQKSFLRGSNDALDHAAAIIRQLLSFARRQTLEFETLHFSDILDESGPLLNAAVGSAIDLDVRDGSGDFLIHVDRSQLVSMLLNLLTNARDAMPDGGGISMRAGLLTLKPGDVDIWPDMPFGDYLLLTIADTGCGMSEATREQAFDPFYTTKDEQTGTGLGLSSVKGFAAQSGGDVRIISSDGTGTTIGLILPRAQASSTHTQQLRPSLRRLDNMSVLLVEDNPSLAQTLVAMMQHLGAIVTHVESADEAIALLSKGQHVEALLSDVRMPGTNDGFDLHQWVRDHRGDVPVVLMTGYSDSDRARDDVIMINKPFSSEQLVAALVSAEASLTA